MACDSTPSCHVCRSRCYPRIRPLGCLTADDRPAKASHPATPQGCAPEASGPVRDPARTAHRRTGLRIGRVPLTCLVPLPLELGLSPVPRNAFRRPPGPISPGVDPTKPDYHLAFCLTPRSLGVSPLGPFPGFSPPHRPTGLPRRPAKRLLTPRESAVEPPLGRLGAEARPWLA